MVKRMESKNNQTKLQEMEEEVSRLIKEAEATEGLSEKRIAYSKVDVLKGKLRAFRELQPELIGLEIKLAQSEEEKAELKDLLEDMAQRFEGIAKDSRTIKEDAEEAVEVISEAVEEVD